MNKLKELMDKKAVLEVESKVLIAKEDATAKEINAKLAEIKAINAKIEAQKQIDEAEKVQAALEAEAKKPVNEPLYAEPKDHNQKKWKGGMGEFLQAVAQASKPGGNFDNRLILQNSASGANENIGSEGGFLLDGNFVQQLMDAMGTEVQVRNRIRMLPLTAANKETSQAAETIVPANINKMWVRMPVRYKKNAVWFINQEVDTALTEMAFGNGTNMHPLSLEYLQKGTLKGAPVIPIEQCSALGAKGDVILCDPTQYIGIDKNAPSADVSIHVRFLYDESLFRFIYRFNGAPYRNKSLTPYKGTLQLSPFVTLDDRK